MPPSPAIKVYATTRDNVPSPVTTYNVAVANVVPGLVPRPVCAILDTSPLCGPSFPVDRREVPVGAPLTIRAILNDVVTARHAVKVFWGDGGSSFLAPGCTDQGCPTPGLVTPPTQNQEFSISHPYERPGTYPIKILVNDGGPGATLTYNTNAVIFGAHLQGPTDVAAGDPATYTYSSPLPVGATLTAVPACGSGALTGSTASSFTCVFPDVPAGTQTSVGVSATIAGIASTLGAVGQYPAANAVRLGFHRTSDSRRRQVGDLHLHVAPLSVRHRRQNTVLHRADYSVHSREHDVPFPGQPGAIHSQRGDHLER